MSRPLIDYYFWLSSDWSFLGHRRLLAIAGRHNAVIRYLPVRMKLLLDKTGGMVLSQRSPQRQRYRLDELRRWRDRLGFPINLAPAHFPVDNEKALRVVAGAIASGHDVGELVEAYMRAVWVEEQDIADRGVVLDIASRRGLRGAEIDTWIASAETDQTLTANTAAAAEAGAFGAPTYVVAGEVFWGQDRLDFLAERVTALALSALARS